MHGEHAAPGEPLAVGGTHPVLVQGLDDGAAHQTHAHGIEAEPEHDRRQPQPTPVVVGAHRRFEPAELDREEVLREERHDEDRDRDRDQRDDERDVVEQLALAQRRDGSDDDRQRELDRDRHDGEAPRDGEGCSEDGRDRATGVGRTEVPLEDTGDVVPVLHDERVVQVVLLAQLLENSRVRGLVSEQSKKWIAGHGEHEEIDEQGGTEEDRDHLQKTSQNVTEHPLCPFLEG